MIKTTLAAAALAVSVAALSAGAANAQELNGKKLFLTKTCVACHGRDGKKAIQVFPEIAAQDPVYLLNQMNDIASGARVSGKDDRGYPRTDGMKDIMHLVSPEERKAIADWLATLPPAEPRTPAEPIAPERLAKGKELYEARECVACHGPTGADPLAEMPALAAMKRDYLVLQMTEIKGQIRKNGMVETMLPFAEKLTDEEIGLIADYLSQTPRVKAQ